MPRVLRARSKKSRSRVTQDRPFVLSDERANDAKSEQPERVGKHAEKKDRRNDRGDDDERCNRAGTVCSMETLGGAPLR